MHLKTILTVLALALFVSVPEGWSAIRGGGSRGGGSRGVSRSSGGSRGGGSVRQSNRAAPSRPAPRPAPSRGWSSPPPAPRPTPSYSRPSSGVGSTYRPSNMGSLGSSSPGNRAATPAASGSRLGASQLPANGTTIGHARGAGVGGVVISGPGGSSAYRLQGTGGGSAAGISGPNGSGAAKVQGPNGGAAAGIRLPSGAAAAGIRGPNGGAAAGIRGPNGGAIGGARGQWGSTGPIARLPEGARQVNWHGNNYYYTNGAWYNPYWHDDAVWYAPVYPPTGYYEPEITWSDVQPVTYNNQTYYQADGVYYQKATQDGKEGYKVVEPPPPTQSADMIAKLDILKKSLAYVAAQPQGTMVVSDTYDEITSGAQKVSYTSRRDITFRRAGSLAVDFQGSDGSHRQSYLKAGQFTLIDQTNNAYSRVTVPDSIDATLDKLSADYGVTVACAELLRTNLYDRIAPRFLDAKNLGKDIVGTFLCDHLSFTLPDATWEFWLESGDTPAVRKFSIAYLNVPSRPRYTMTIPKFDTAAVADTAFDAVIPANAAQVPLLPAAATTQPAK